jgi:hypothetical protein
VARGVGDDVEAIGNATRVHVPPVQLPPRGVWGAGGQVRYAPFTEWTGLDLDESASIEVLVRRYLAAFGPATAKDMQTWSGLTKLAPVFERLRPELVCLRDEDGRELFDLPEAPVPTATSRPRCGSSGSTTTCCSVTTTAAGSSPRASRGPSSSAATGV